MELELEPCGAGAPAAGQRLLQAEAPADNEPEAVVGSRRSGRADSMLRWFITVLLCAAFLGLGMSVAILGPTFQDLATNVNRNISSLSLIFVGRAFGYLGGSVIGGVLFDSMNHFLLLGVSMFATTVGLYLVPFCKTAVLLIVMMSTFGVSIGILDTGTYLDYWDLPCGPLIDPFEARQLVSSEPAGESHWSRWSWGF